MREWRKLPQWLVRKCLRGYQLVISPLLMASCRFQPSCSQYAIDAVEKHGIFHGLLLAARRISRCHPWGSSGFDPVPEIKKTKHSRKRRYKHTHLKKVR